MASKCAASGLMTATLENQRGAQKYWARKSKVISEVGLPCPVSQGVLCRKEGDVLKIVWVGQHTPGKALNLAINGLCLINRDVKWKLYVLGQGEKTEQWKFETQRKGINDKCHFYGWLQRNETLAVMKNSHVLLITSLRDLTSTVAVEALALGLPIICLDHCGFSHVVNDSCGIKVPVSTPEAVAKSIAAAVEQLAGDEDCRQRLAEGALIRAQDFTWEKKAEIVNRIYSERIREAGMGPRCVK